MPATAATIANQAATHPAALRTLQHHATHTATTALAAALTAARNTATTQWLHATGPARALPTTQQLNDLITRIRAALANIFRTYTPHAQQTAHDAAATAARLGARQAATIATALTGHTAPLTTPTPGTIAQQAADTIPAAIEQEHNAALALLTTASLTALGLAGLSGVFNRAGRAIGRIAAAIATAVTSAAAAGVAAIARALGPDVRLLWVAEPDACPACAAYAGRTIRPGERFPGGLSLDPRRTVFTAAIPAPPRHPHCRCVLIPWRADWHTGGTPLPDLLRQRARQTTARRPR